jgi:hypothetical protein
MFFPSTDVTALDTSWGATLAELLSHLPGVPILVHFVVLRQFYAAVVLGAVLFFSPAYHMCRGDWYCFGFGNTSRLEGTTLVLEGLENARRADHAASIHAFPALVLIALAGTNIHEPRMIVAQLALLFTTIYAELAFPFQLYGLIIIYIVTAFVVICTLFWRRSLWLPMASRFGLPYLMGSLALGMTGVVLFSIATTEETYNILHPIWHVLIFVAYWLAVLGTMKDRLGWGCDGRHYGLYNRDEPF